MATNPFDEDDADEEDALPSASSAVFSSANKRNPFDDGARRQYADSSKSRRVSWQSPAEGDVERRTLRRSGARAPRMTAPGDCMSTSL